MKNQQQNKLSPSTPIKSSKVYWIKKHYHNPIYKWLEYYLTSAILYGLSITFLQHCCHSITPASIFHGVSNFLLSTLFGIQRWMWFHTGDAHRPNAGQTVIIYTTLIFTIAFLYDALLKKSNRDNLIENLSSAIFGVLISHIPIALMLTDHDIEHPILVFLNAFFLNTVSSFTASIYCILHLNQLPFINIMLNRILVIAGFITGLSFTTLYGTIIPPLYSIVFLDSSHGRGDFIAIILICYALAILATIGLFKFFNLKRRLEKLEATESFIEPEDQIEIDEENLKQRLRE